MKKPTVQSVNKLMNTYGIGFETAKIQLFF